MAKGAGNAGRAASTPLRPVYKEPVYIQNMNEGTANNWTGLTALIDPRGRVIDAAAMGAMEHAEIANDVAHAYGVPTSGDSWISLDNLEKAGFVRMRGSMTTTGSHATIYGRDRRATVRAAQRVANSGFFPWETRFHLFWGIGDAFGETEEKFSMPGLLDARAM